MSPKRAIPIIKKGKLCIVVRRDSLSRVGSRGEEGDLEGGGGDPEGKGEEV